MIERLRRFLPQPIFEQLAFQRTLKEDLIMSTNRTATLTIDGKTVEFPVMVGTHGQDVIDIRTLGAKTGLLPTTPASCPRQLPVEGHLHRRRQGRTAVSRLPDRAAWPKSATSSKSPTC
jgi:hypothetical protein